MRSRICNTQQLWLSLLYSSVTYNIHNQFSTFYFYTTEIKLEKLFWANNIWCTMYDCQIIFRPFQIVLLLDELSKIIYSCLLTLTVGQNLARSNQLNVSHLVILVTSFVGFRCTYTHWLNTPLRFGPHPLLVLLILSRAFNVHSPNAFLVFEIYHTRNAWLKLNYHHSNTAVLFTTWHFVSKLSTALKKLKFSDFFSRPNVKIYEVILFDLPFQYLRTTCENISLQSE